uniref:Putative endonuclease SegE-like GIY-YIG domain-containing protein n=1 Tax=viral metagenome TaxID=1070528 RepID=A0A6C0DZE8_9ZZZZ
MDQGEIYMITCPEGKVYIGQTVCFLSNGKKYGSHRRWVGHLSDSRRKDGGRCRKLNEAIRLFGENAFKITILLTTHTSLLDEFEEITISLLDTTNPEHGYNLRYGGNHSRLSKETRLLMREKRLQYTLPRPSQHTKEKISKTLINNVIRYDHNGKVLPKYVKFINWNDRCGYAIVSHPNCKLKYFVSNKKSLNEQYDKCIHFLRCLQPI